MFRLFCILIGYIFGCIQTSYFVGKITANIDIREHGSRNAGMTNTIRVIGRRAGLVVFICDILKSVAAYIVCSLIFDGGGSFFSGSAGMLPGLYAGIGVVIGHNFPAFLEFKGGKGIASSLGSMLCLDWKIAIITYVCGICCVAFTKYISFASLIMVLLFPTLLLIFGSPLEVIIVLYLMATLAFFMHRGNISRLLAGNERKFTLRKSQLTK